MKALTDVVATPEQLAIFSRLRDGVEVIRGAAGSGKTTTAILKLKANIGFFLSRRARQSQTEPVRVLVLTFNRTLRGYIETLAMSQVAPSKAVDIEVETFGKWAKTSLGVPKMLSSGAKSAWLLEFGHQLGLGTFLEGEVDYAMGRFLPSSLASYTTARRHGRGSAPRVEKGLREKIIADVIAPYEKRKKSNDLPDWNDLAIALALKQVHAYDIVVVDEAQDFSANQVRAVMNQLNKAHSVTFVLDTAQRIYAHGFTWQEVGIPLRAENSHRLENNYRNTKQIAAFAIALLDGIEVDDDYTLPNLKTCTRSGEKPVLLSGRYASQIDFALKAIKEKINLKAESVVFLHPLGGGWLDYLRGRLAEAKLPFVEIARQSEWPQGSENIGLSTLHSAKGLEFDHVFILGLNAEVLPQGETEKADDRHTAARKLLAMGVTRARKSVAVGFKDSAKSSLIDYFDPKTCELVEL